MHSANVKITVSVALWSVLHVFVQSGDRILSCKEKPTWFSTYS